MQLKVGISRKEGRPGYGSEGAIVEIMLDVAERTVSESPASLVDEIRRAFALCETAVGEQLARTAPADHHQVEPARDRDRQPSQARPPSEPEPDRQPPRRGRYDPDEGPDGAKRWQHDAEPKSGRELIAWARKKEERGESPGLFKRLVRFGESQGYPPRIVDWSRDEVYDATAAVRRGTDTDEPARNGTASRNGYR